jgi:hypothetical protein
VLCHVGRPAGRRGGPDDPGAGRSQPTRADGTGPPGRVADDGRRRRAKPAATAGSAGTTGMGSTGSAAPAYQGPHFATPQEAMTYMATAYDSDDTADLHAVTDSQAFTALLSMRPSDTDLQLESCTARATGDYVCSVRYDYVHGQQNSESKVAMIIAAPALSPGWYMYKFISGCGGLVNR